MTKKETIDLATLRKYLFRAAIWLLIAGVILGGVTILVADMDTVGEVLGKTVGTIFLASLAMMIGVVGFRMIETGKKATQIFAAIGLGAGILSVVLWMLAIWAWRPLYYSCSRNDAECIQWVDRQNSYERKYSSSYRTTYTTDDCPSYIYEDCHLTWLWRFVMMATFIGSFGLVAAGIMKMYEGQKKDLVRPLKIASVSLAGYVCFFGCLSAVTGWMTGDAEFSSGMEEMMERLGILASFAAIVWILVFLVAFVISRTEKNRAEMKKRKADELEAAKKLVKQEQNSAEAGQDENSDNEDVSEKDREPIESTMRVKSDEELRAEIEEQVRREMIEKEVREKFEREQRERMEKVEGENTGEFEIENDDAKDDVGEGQR